MERTFVMIKPDGLTRGIVGQIISRFEARGFRVVSARTLEMSEGLVREHYRHLVGRPFFHEVEAYMTSGPVLAMVLEAPNAVEVARRMLGATDPAKAASGTVRRDFATSMTRNLAHAADSREAARAEIQRFFGPCVH
ncbi:MAG TPA: nucleoside-diphosphate kinase [Firmicutes bacterium]|jgi:nucleoside-diphosphate kinase|nr:nucleoside-diphosphate kinase [Bacillota bacterium]